MIKKMNFKILKSLLLKWHHVVYWLIEFTLILHVVTIIIERVFLTMKILKTYLRKRIGYEWLNDSVMLY